MRELPWNDVGERLSEIVDEVVSGEPVVIMRQGRKEAVLISWDNWQRVSNGPTFAHLLMDSPLEESDLEPLVRSPVRDIEI